MAKAAAWVRRRRSESPNGESEGEHGEVDAEEGQGKGEIQVLLGRSSSSSARSSLVRPPPPLEDQVGIPEEALLVQREHRPSLSESERGERTASSEQQSQSDRKGSSTLYPALDSTEAPPGRLQAAQSSREGAIDDGVTGREREPASDSVRPREEHPSGSDSLKNQTENSRNVSASSGAANLQGASKDVNPSHDISQHPEVAPATDLPQKGPDGS
uniref:Uncharacterized protein n=1 Tax=Chromera velia CCMP2878 TaxID=1169474 RepID=A0A0G4I355_9ALVE|eukprot:Cvel_10566.t1-p1 / transcript=Cvel_10566.t1 / gene=Cvel_10566 / organism=Chromera_velia_CCMP2878 / gene_product=hypothetical protein / transcript_product=hypothetical protein / location=Cvel_scaffold640:14528-15169(-) / protein_length=214 / sequence_SO=supercontig / SO=protein_coding / is_pseudo=false